MVVRSTLFISVAAMVATAPLAGQSADHLSRTLNGYPFVVSLVAPTPFPATSISGHVGGAMALDVRTLFIDFSGDTLGTLSGDVASMLLGFDYQQRLGKWFAMHIGVDGLARTGTNSQSALAQGITAGLAVRIGAVAQLLRRTTFILSATLDVERSGLVGIDAYRFARSVVDNGLTEASPTLLANGNITSGEASVRVGWAPTPWVGITGSLTGGVSSFSNSSSQSLVAASSTVGIDLNNLVAVPVGIQLSAAMSSDRFTDTEQDLRDWDLIRGASSVGLGIFYSGWQDFSIGLETTMFFVDRTGGLNDVNTGTAVVSMRYWPLRSP